jgi:hypothetical protein
MRVIPSPRTSAGLQGLSCLSMHTSGLFTLTATTSSNTWQRPHCLLFTDSVQHLQSACQ